MIVTPITHPFPGEHLARTWPTMRLHTDDSRPLSHPGWRLRLRYWAGRALTADALELDQENRAANLAWRGRQVTAGIVDGLEVGLEPPPALPDPLTFAGHFLHLLPGHGISTLGDDVAVPRPLRIALDRIPIDGMEPGELPWAAVLVLRPAEFRRFDNLDPDDPCELDPSRDAFADERRQDAMLLQLVPLPPEWETLSELGDAGDPRRRNRLAHFLFAREAAGAARQLLRFQNTRPAGQRWDTLRREAEVFPWELAGVPLALLGSEVIRGTTERRLFLDRAAVARAGGRMRARSRPVTRLATAASEAAFDPPGSGSAALWRARVDQLAEQLGAFDATVPISEQAQYFQFLPPAGLLPRPALRILTTEEALAVNAPDRAATSRFLPPNLAVEAVPVPIEDLDAALAASAPLAPFDLTTEAPEVVRMLVPLSQRNFDPHLLVVEREDPVFAREVGRLVAQRQDWRQRWDDVRDWRNHLENLVTGPRGSRVDPPLERGQLEPEPVETVAGLGFSEALLSPNGTRAPWEVEVAFATPRRVTPDTRLFVSLRIDADAPPGPIDIRWRSGGREFARRWNSPPDYPLEQLDADGQPLATRLWLRFTVRAGDIGFTNGEATGFALQFASGRIALSQVGELVAGQRPDELVESPFWRAEDRPANGANLPAVRFSGGDWTSVAEDGDASPLGRNRLLAPFEETHEPAFEDDQSLDDRLDDLDSRLRLTTGNRVRDIGLERLIANVETRIKRGDDSVDLGFLKSQANVHRVRQVILGDEAANELLTSPVLSSVVEAKSARLTTDALLAAYKNLPDAAPRTGDDPAGRASVGSSDTSRVIATRSFGGVVNTGSGGSSNVFNPRTGGGFTFPADTFGGGKQFADFQAPQTKGQFATPAKDDVVGSEPIIGQGFELRTLSFAKRFNEGATRTAFNYADAELRDTIGQVLSLDLGMEQDSEPIPEALDDAGRPVTFGQLATQGRALLDRLQFPGLSTGDDSSSILSRGVRRADAAVLVLRRFEFHLARLRETLKRAREVLAAVRTKISSTTGRILVLDGRLAEARHDVSVARALRVEEQERVAAINTRRDQLIRDEVKFLAYVRPRAVDPVRRTSQYWNLEHADTPTPVPACLQEHDEPPDPLRAYVQLFRHAPARWFTAVAPRLAQLNTREKLFELAAASRLSALNFMSRQQLPFVQADLAPAPLAALQSGYAIIAGLRQQTAAFNVAALNTGAWSDRRKEAERHASLGDLIDGRHGQTALTRAAADELERIEKVATCLHAEFAAIPPAVRLGWVERYSQFDRPSPLHQLTVLPQFGRLPRETRRRFQEFSDWLFGRVTKGERDAFNLMNDLVRICLLLASHAPVKSIIAGHVPRPVPVRPGLLIPLRPLQPLQVRVGMQFQVWRASTLVARGQVEDLRDDEVSARVDHVASAVTTVDQTMRVQFVAQTFGV